MTRTKNVNGVRVDLTAQENEARDIEEVEALAAREAAEAAKATADLTRAEFIGMIAAKELDVIWHAMQSALAGVPGMEAENSRAALASNLHAKFYNLAATRTLVAQFRGFAETLDASYADMLTDENITAAWKETVSRRSS